MVKSILLESHQFRVKTLYWNHADLELFTSCSRNPPAPWIHTISRILSIMEAKTMVEIGTSWQLCQRKCVDFFNQSVELAKSGQVLSSTECCQSGHSTYFWAKTGIQVHSVDTNPHCIGLVHETYQKLGEFFPQNLSLHTQDGLEFVKKFDGIIDFLYLDAWDIGVENGPQMHAEVYLAARDKLAKRHLIAIDDSDFLPPVQGKDAVLSPLLINSGYIKLISGRQSVFLSPQYP